MPILHNHITKLNSMKKYPQKIYYKGDMKLLKKDMVSIVGTRKPNEYTKRIVLQIASSLANRGIVIVSGAAIGVDAIAHNGAGFKNTIAVLGNGINHRYPKINSNLIESIETKGGLVLSQFEPDFLATPWSFVVRNELVVALGSILIVAQADLNSGSMHSIEYAKKMGKQIFVIPHRIGESEGTNSLLQAKEAKAIYDIEEFANSFGKIKADVNSDKDDFIKYCKTSPLYEEALKKFGQKVFEAEIEGTIIIKDGRIIKV